MSFKRLDGKKDTPSFEFVMKIVEVIGLAIIEIMIKK